MMKELVQERLTWAQDQCPLPGSPIPSLPHTRWYGAGQNLADRLLWQPDGYTTIVYKSRLLSWYRSFTIASPHIPESTSLITISEWLPRYEPASHRGWLVAGQPYTTAYARLHPSYLQDWRDHARRHLRVFQRAECQLRLGTRDDVVKLYATSQVPKSLQRALLGNLDKRLAVHPHTIDILVAEKDGQSIACLVAGNCDEAYMSEYIIGAFHPDYKKLNAMVGLVDWWYRRSLERCYTTLTFGHMEPSAARSHIGGSGYSFFKTHFGVERFWFPRNHWQFKINHKGLFSRS